MPGLYLQRTQSLDLVSGRLFPRMAQATATPSDNEVRWGRVGAALNNLNREVHPYIESELKGFFQKLPRLIRII